MINIKSYFDFQVLSAVALAPRSWKTALQLQEAKCRLRYHESDWLQYKGNLVPILRERHKRKCCLLAI